MVGIPNPELGRAAAEAAQVAKDVVAVAVPTAIALGLPFSKASREKIWKRDKGKCQWEGCDKSAKDGWRLDAAHFDHDKSKPWYDDPSNGRLLCLEHHAEDHLRRAKAEKGGGHFGAVNAILRRAQRKGTMYHDPNVPEPVLKETIRKEYLGLTGAVMRVWRALFGDREIWEP